jgi:1-acyl-sn-glycerol-3-phosphate acyltransferase
MKNRLISIGIWIFGALSIVAVFLAMLFFSTVLYPFDRQRRVAHMQCYWWSDAVIAINPYWKVKVSGLENIDHKKTYVIIANHQSMADIAIAYQMKTQFKWVAKDSLFRVPFLGWSMSLGKHIKLERGDFSSIKYVYREAAVWIKNGMSVLFFPEGTRSETGKLKEFQNGAFKLAIKEGVPVLPVAIKGTFDVIKKGSWLFTPKADIRLTVLPAIETSGMGQGDFAALRDRAHDAIEKA